MPDRGTFLVRDSKQPEDGQLALPPAAWSAFVAYTSDAQI
ncbi:DUF397 domain-containing protein [Streptomyces sp. NPDC005708]